MKLFNVILIVYSLLIGSVFGATITDDTVKIGKPGSSANKEITLGTSKKIRANESTGKLEFSNDGVLYKNLGSGSGSGGSTGTNLIVNDSFEDGIGSPWTSSGGTFTQETYAVGFEGNTKYARFVASGAGQYVEQIVSVPTSFSGGCQADFKKVNVSTAGLFKVQALDTSNNVLAEQTIGVSSWVKIPTFGFPCPASGTNNLKLRMISISAGTIDFDLGYVGSNQNLVSISQARLMGVVKITGCASAWSTGSTTFASFAAQSGCSYTTEGAALAPSTNIPAIKFASLPAGDYRLEYEGAVGTSGGGTGSYFQFSDGINTAREESSVSLNAASLQYPTSTISQSISYSTAQSNITLNIRAKVSSGTAYLFGSNANPAVIKVWYFPTSTETAVSNEQSSWYIDANIGGASPSTSLTTSYLPFEHASLDLVLNSGSAAATIPCSGTNASTGLTCSSGNEQVGVVFSPPYAGTFEACLSGGITSTGVTLVTTQWVETSLSSQTIIQEGKTRPLTSSSASGNSSNLSNCGIFTFSDTSTKTLRFSYEAQDANSSITADRSAVTGQRDIHIVVRPLLSAYNRPILTGDQVVSKGGEDVELISFLFSNSSINTPCTTSTCSTFRGVGTQPTNVTRGTPGQYSANFPSTFSTINCGLLSGSGVAGVGITAYSPANIWSCSNCSSVPMYTIKTTDNAYVDSFASVICHAIK